MVAIENKIRAGAVSNGQLQREYDGLVGDKNVMETGSSSRRLMMIYLAPIGCDSALAEFERLKSPDHTKIFVTWQADPVEPGPSIASVIRSLLAGEADGDVAPIHEYVRHMLKSLLNFVADGFSGYPFTDGRTPSSGLNALTERRLRFVDLIAKPADDGFVGIQGGIVGLLRDLNSGKIRTHQYQYTTQSEINGKPSWIPVQTFQLIAEIEKGSCDLSWLDGPLRLPADTIVYLAKRCPTGFYVGLRGGASELKRLVGERRAGGPLVWRSTDVWNTRQDTTMLARTAWWMRADEFLKAVE